MTLLNKIEELSKNCLFQDNSNEWLADLSPEVKELFQQNNQLKLRELIASHKQFADTVEVVNFDEQ